MIIIEVVVGVICICDRIVQQVLSSQYAKEKYQINTKLSLTESVDSGKVTSDYRTELSVPPSSLPRQDLHLLKKWKSKIMWQR